MRSSWCLHTNQFVWRIFTLEPLCVCVCALTRKFIRFYTDIYTKLQTANKRWNMIISKYDRLIQFGFSTTTLVHLICEKIKRPHQEPGMREKGKAAESGWRAKRNQLVDQHQLEYIHKWGKENEHTNTQKERRNPNAFAMTPKIHTTHEMFCAPIEWKKEMDRARNGLCEWRKCEKFSFWKLCNWRKITKPPCTWSVLIITTTKFNSIAWQIKLFFFGSSPGFIWFCFLLPSCLAFFSRWECERARVCETGTANTRRGQFTKP